MYKKIWIYFLLLPVSLSFSLESLSDGYKNIKLGMSQQQVKNILQTSKDFNIKKEEILSFRIQPDTDIISTEGLGFIQLGYFHFNHDQLFQIFLKINAEKVGYYYLLKQLTNRFGNPNQFSPKRAIWENEKVRIVLEKPCVLKYIYLPIWNDLLKTDTSSDTILDIARDQFSNDL